MTRSRSRFVRAAAVGAVAALLLTACSGNSGGGDSGKDGNVSLKVAFFGDFGLDELKGKYEAANPGVKIVLNSGEYNAHHEDLQKKLIAGSGASDIVAIDEGFVVQMRGQKDKFVNLLDKGASKYADKYLEWKWKSMLSTDGSHQIGLGTDVGGLAMCYRTDLFKKANLPTDREAVSALWPTWDGFIETGKKYVKATNKKFVDSGTNLFNPIVGQQPVGIFDESDKLALDGGPKASFDITMKAIEANLSANLTAFQPDWNAGFTKDAFAVLACPAWMQGHIQNTAPNQKGKWDIASIPGGGGNWGGSFLALPKQGKNVDAAYKFLEWLVQPEQQIEIFNKVGNLPSQPALYDDPAIKEFKNPFFSNAPVGTIFSASAKELTPQYLGKKNGQARVAIENVIRRAENGDLKGKPQAQVWSEVVKAAEKAAAS